MLKILSHRGDAEDAENSTRERYGSGYCFRQGYSGGHRLDLVAEERVIIELKAVSKLELIHDAQVLTYLKMTGLKLGLLLNFNVSLMRDGIRRIVNGLQLLWLYP